MASTVFVHKDPDPPNGHCQSISTPSYFSLILVRDVMKVVLVSGVEKAVEKFCESE
jgi:hypothetical protein